MGFETETTYYNEMLESHARIEELEQEVKELEVIKGIFHAYPFEGRLSNRILHMEATMLRAQRDFARAEATIAGLVEVVTIMWDAMNDKAHAWNHARKWLDEHDIYHGDLQENAVLAEVCKVSLTCAAGKES